jgi:hypothetical protein
MPDRAHEAANVEMMVMVMISVRTWPASFWFDLDVVDRQVPYV